MSFVIRTLVKVFELEPILSDGEPLCYRLEIFSDGEVYTARLRRYEFYRVQPTFPQKEGEPNPMLQSDETFLIRDTELGGQVEALQEASESDLLQKVATLFAATFR